MKAGGRRNLAAMCIVAAAAAWAPHARAVELWASEQGEQSIDLDTAVKWSSLGAYAPDDPRLYPERATGTALFRLRLGLNVQFDDRITSELAYEHRAQLATASGGASASAGILPSLGEAPYRLTQLDWELAGNGDTTAYRHEIDRALVAFHPKWGSVVVGRQAIGLGRGVLFGAVDVFSPFSPAEVDREWRRGIDAVRAEYHLSDTSAVELIGAFGPSWDDSAALARARGYFGNTDAELIIGKRAEDFMVGTSLSRTVKDAEVHLELAVFHTPESQPEGGLFGDDHLVGKAVLGSSYTFDIGNGLTVIGEYHYCGFGVEDIDRVTGRAARPEFQERYLRGDLQILGQHALGLQASYSFGTAWAGYLMILQSPIDGSGLASPALNWDFSNNASLRLSAFFPWGDPPRRGRIRSEYGAVPISLFLQLSAYF
ncbi:MAG: hypothetical protein JXR94_10615 [Candidatus Hydrogenedentes bacterium]|nr:hypothetical protein [Candidatus Hydrogenedentota bacterium]